MTTPRRKIRLAAAGYHRWVWCSRYFLPLALLLASCAPRRAPEPPVPMIAQVEQQEFNRAQAALKAGNLAAAQHGFLLFVKRYPKSGLADDAWYQVGLLLQRQKLIPEAIRSFQRIIENYPTADTLLLAKLRYVSLHREQDRLLEVVPVLESIPLKNLPGELKLNFLTLLREAYQKRQEPSKLLDIDIAILELSPADTEVRGEVIQMIDAPMAIEALETLADRSENSFPTDFALMRLAKLYAQAGKLDKTKSRLRNFLERFRDAGKLSELTREAEQLLSRYDRLGEAKAGVIGVLLPLSGAYESVGRKLLQAILLASGFFDGSQNSLQLVVRDTAGEAERTAQMYDELVLDEQVVGVIGPLFKKESASVGKIAAAYATPTIMMSQEENLENSGGYVFQNSLLKSSQIEALTNFMANELRVKRLAFLYPNHAYGQELFQAMWEALAEYPDMEIRGAQAYEKDTNDFSPHIRRLTGLFYSRLRADEICPDKIKPRALEKSGKTKEVNCFERENLPAIVDFEALFIPDSAEKIRQIAPTLSYYGVRGIQLLGANLWNTPELLEKGTVEHLQGAVYVDGYNPQSSKPEVQAFHNRYRQNFGEAPDMLSAQAYDTMMILRQAALNNALNRRDDLSRFLTSMPAYQGATGKTKFSRNGQAEREINYFIIDGNQSKLLRPTS